MILPNALTQHTGLSLQARGLAAFLLSLPDGTDISIRALAARLTEGEIAIGRALRELETAGYLTRQRVRDASGRITTITTMRDVPAADLGVSPEAPAAAPEPAPEPAASTPEPAQQPAPEDEPAAPSAPKPTPRAPAPSLDAVTAGTRVLLDVAAVEPRLTVGARALPALAALVDQALAADVAPAEIHRALTANLPGEIRSAAALIRHRLDEHLPVWTAAATVRALRASAPTTPRPRVEIAASPAAARWTECGDCARPLRTATPDGLCGDCRAVPAA
ncbi:helix-turn-helix domain-containing protein [Actinomadura gamaensis]|uniref:Helix-turn-helix domain-containing protein n=1 Tax=Actinomadura gamaensis TaxID=1763541 RepID=A0ABV9U8Q9_9ACTN